MKHNINIIILHTIYIIFTILMLCLSLLTIVGIFFFSHIFSENNSHVLFINIICFVTYLIIIFSHSYMIVYGNIYKKIMGGLPIIFLYILLLLKYQYLILILCVFLSIFFFIIAIKNKIDEKYYLTFYFVFYFVFYFILIYSLLLEDMRYVR